MHFHIDAGMKVVRGELGNVADYCPLCHEIRSCTIRSVSHAFHVYGVAVEKLELLGHEIRCTVCKVVRETHPAIFKTIGSSAVDADLATLVERSQPDIQTRYAERLALDVRMRRGDLRRDERIAVLVKTLKVVNPMVASRSEDKHFDRWGKLGLFLICGGAALPVALVVEALGSSKESSLVAALIATFAALVFTVTAVVSEARRFTRNQVAPLLAQSLKPLGLDSDEIEVAVRTCAEEDLAIGRLLRAGDLYAALR